MLYLKVPRRAQLYGCLIGCGLFVCAPHDADAGPNAASQAVVAFGAALFADVNLSANKAISCATCHRPDHAYADTTPASRGVGGNGTRNAISLLSVGPHNLFWDGRRTSLELLVVDPLLNPQEQGMRDINAVIAVVRQRHEVLHALAFGQVPISQETIASALAAFVRSLQNDDAPFDRFRQGEQAQLTISQRRGLELFEGTAGCASCHTLTKGNAAFTDDAFHAGEANADFLPAGQVAKAIAKLSESRRFELVAVRNSVAALGRFVVTLRPEDIGAVRTPSLRNVAVTAPYMHDGSVKTLSEAVDRELYWRAGGDARLGRLTPKDRADLVAFLESLTSVPQAGASGRQQFAKRFL